VGERLADGPERPGRRELELFVGKRTASFEKLLVRPHAVPHLP
jgi:hypothetical protein